MAHLMPVGWGDDLRWERPYQFCKELREGKDPSIEAYLNGPQWVQERIFELLFSAKLDHDQQWAVVEASCRTRFGQFASVIDKVVVAKKAFADGQSTQPADGKPPTIRFKLRAKYQLLELISGGGYGKVYRAFDWNLRQYVAIKVLKGSKFEDCENVEAFRREAQLLARLKHPQIVRVYQPIMDAAGTRPAAIVMEFVCGRSLADLLVGPEPLPSFDRVASIVAGVAAVLASAHTQGAGVIHRDLKPSNIIIDDEDQPHLVDFGMSLLASGARFRTKMREGTLPYMSPEQLTENAEVDRRTDIWSLGVVFYEMLTRRRPFRGSEEEIVRVILTADVPLLRRDDFEIPRELEKICLRCLSRDPAHRFRSAAEVASRLNKWLVFGDSAPAFARYLKQLRRHLEHIPTVSGASISIADTCVSRLIAEDEDAKKIIKEKKQEGTVSLRQAVEWCNSFQVLGPSGAGKSVALQQIARSCATAWLQDWRDGKRERGPIPIRIELWRCNGEDLIPIATRKLNRRGIGCDETLVTRWVQSGECILLLDAGHGDLTETAGAIKELLEVCPKARYVLASQAEGIAELQNAPRFSLVLLSTADAGRILRNCLPESRAREILRYLVDRGLIEPFRLPILAWFLAKAHADTTRPITTNPGQLYHHVITERLLKGKASSGALGLLAGMGYAMVEANCMSLEQDIGVRARPGTLSAIPAGLPSAELLQQVLDLGLVVQSGAHLRFQYDTFREHFCAVWLSQTCDAHEAARKAKQIQVAEVWSHYIGLVDDSTCREFLRILLMRARWALRLSFWRASTNPSDLILALRCLVNDPYPHEDLRDAMVKMLDGSAGRRKETSNAPVRSHQIARWLAGTEMQIGPKNDEFTDFLEATRWREIRRIGSELWSWYDLIILVSRLRTVKSAAYVEQEMKTRGNWAPLACLRAEQPAVDTVKRIMEDFADPAQRYEAAGLGLARLLLRLPAALVIPAIRQTLQNAEPVGRQILDSLGSHNRLSWDAQNLEDWSFDGATTEARAWILFLCDTILSSPAGDTSTGALRALRQFGGGKLPLAAWRIFYRALNASDAQERVRAAWPLVYTPEGKCGKTVARLRRLLRSETVVMCQLHLVVLEHLGTKDFPTDLCRVMRRFHDETARAGIRSIAQAICSDQQKAIDPKKAQTVATLLWGLQLDGGPLPYMCVHAVERYRSAYVRRSVEGVFDSRAADAVRAECVTSLMNIAENAGDLQQAASIVYKALIDPSETVRLAAIERLAVRPYWTHHPLMDGAQDGLARCLLDANKEIRQHSAYIQTVRNWQKSGKRSADGLVLAPD